MTSPTPSTAARRKNLTLGPGTLTFGSVGSILDMSCQITEIKFAAEGDSEDAELVLCGDSIAGARTYTWTMSGTTYQDLETDGVIDWSWKYAGTEVPFKFVPDSTGESAVTGRVIVDPIELGGTVGQKNKSEFEWGLVAAPSLRANTTTQGT